jgi:hypothetical protein
VVRGQHKRADARGVDRLSDAAWSPLVVLLLFSCAPKARGQVLDTYFSQIGAQSGGIPADATRTLVAEDYAPVGFRVGTVTLAPSVTEGLGYDSNVNGLHLGPSVLVESQGNVVARTDASQFNLSAELTLDDRRYLAVPSQSSTNWTASLGATYNFGTDQLGLSYSHLNLVQTAGQIASSAVLPIPYHVDILTGSYTFATTGAFSLQPGFDIRSYGFDTIPVAGEGYTDAIRNRVTAQESLVGRYELAPDRDLLLVLNGTEIRYEHSLPNIPALNSNGGSVLAGLDYSATGVFRYRALVGYEVRNYQAGVYGQISSPIIEASVTWQPTLLTTVVLSARRDIEDSLSEAVSEFTYTTGSLSISHELRRNVELSASLQVQTADSRASSVVTEGSIFNTEAGHQTIYSAGLSANWKLNRMLSLTLSDSFSARTGQRTTAYQENIVMLGIGLAL